MDRTSQILIAGCGYVGSRLARLLADAGDSVYALRRGSAAPMPGVTPVKADLFDPGSLKRLPRFLTGVVFAAGPSSPDEAGYRRIFVDGLRNLIETLESREQLPNRLVFTSSTAVYAQSSGEWVDENSPSEPHSFRGQVLLEAESLVHASSIPATALRLGGIYGPCRSWPIESLRSGTALIRGDGAHYTNRIHRDDAAGAIRHLLALERVEPIYLGVDSLPAEESEVLRYLACELGIVEPPRVAPGEPGPTRRAGSKRCRNDRLLESGYLYCYPTYREGYEAMLRELDS